MASYPTQQLRDEEPLSSISSSSSSSSQWKYDVFLSFSGEDTRKGFTGHLYSCLIDRGVVPFRDDPKLEKGTNITPELLKAIAESWCSIIIFSKKYASSSWCLDELVEILKQRKQRGHKIYPVFYDVDPRELRKQEGSVQSAFAQHEKRYNQDTTQRWRDALHESSCITGWKLKDRYESEFIQEIARTISTELCQTYSSVCNDLIGIDSRLAELRDKICFREDDVRIIGICGMGGIGKTTLARFVCEHMSGYFEGKCFLEGVREVSMKSGLVSLQEQLLSRIFPQEKFEFPSVYDGIEIISRRLRHKRVLVVIDNAENMQHIKCLAEKRDWFGLGSRIIITTRDEHLLRAYGVDDVYKPTTLDDSDALHLLNLKAFKSVKPENDFMWLSQSVVKYASGLPLALEVLGSFLCGRDEAQWRSSINRLKSEPEEEIHNCLQISFDGLKETEQNIFLDVAHFFNGCIIDFVTKILDACEYYPDIGLNVLIDKSLITVKHNRIWMHDLLQEMGRYIVRQKSFKDPGKRCRLVEESDVYKVLTQNLATKAIEGMVINNNITWVDKTFPLQADAFLNMKRLRLLIIRGVIKSCDLAFLSTELRLFEWPGYPLRSLPLGFRPDNLVALILPNSCIERLWEGKRPLSKLKVLNLQGSFKLTRTPDFTLTRNLESLNLEGCTNLVHFHPSIASLEKIKLLNLRNCTSLRSLPTKIGMESLETLILSGCSSIRRFPEITRKMKCLMELCLDGTGIKELPTSFGHLNSLKVLNLSSCSKLKNFPELTMTRNLESLNFESCTSLVDVHPSIAFLSKLKLLNLKNCTSLRSLPTKIGMESLEILILSGCLNLQSFPKIDGKMECLRELYLDGTSIEELPTSVAHLNCLQVLNLSFCSHLENLPTSFIENVYRMGRGLLSSSMNLMLFNKRPNSKALTLTYLSSLSCLKELNISGRNLCEGVLPSDVFDLPSLEKLILTHNNFVSLPANLCQLSKLWYLGLDGCKRLKSLPELPSSIVVVDLDGCASLETFPKLGKGDGNWHWTYVCGANCFKLGWNGNALRYLKAYLKAFANAMQTLHIVIPGSEILEWFSHQSEESSVRITLPPILQIDSQWLGIALCCVLGRIPPYLTQDEINCAVIIHFGDFECKVPCIGFYCGSSSGNISKDHLWLRYIPRIVLDEFLKSKSDQYEILGSTDWIGRCIGFEIVILAEFITVKKCGARLVYQSEIDDIDPAIQQLTVPILSNIDEIHQHTTDGLSKKRKRYY